MKLIDKNFRLQTAVPLHEQIVHHVERQIASGVFSAHERLPPATQLARQWGASYVTVQRAMAQLTSAGLIERKPRRGTFVRPHAEKAVIGILIAPNMMDETAHFHRAVIKHLREQIARREGCQWTCRVYDGLAAAPAGRDSENSFARQQFNIDFQNYPFKGLIELDENIRAWERGKPRPNLSTVRLGPPLKCDNGRADVVLDFYDFGRKAVEYLAGKGRTRIAYLRTREEPWKNSPDMRGIREAAEAAGIQPAQAHQLRGISAGEALEGGIFMERSAHDLVLRLLAGWKSGRQNSRRLDALLVSDDIATRGAATALLRGGIAVPDDILVLTMANEGIFHHYGIPVARYELPLRLIAQRLLEVLWKRILGRPAGDLPVKVSGSGIAESAFA